VKLTIGLFLLVFSFAAAGSQAAADASERSPVYVPLKTYAYYVAPARAGFLTAPTAQESAAVDAHFEYLQQLLARDRLILAGRSIGEQTNGIILFQARDDTEARSIADNDPAVKAGVFSMQFAPFALALRRDVIRSQPDRSDRIVRHEVVVAAPLDRVWTALTTTAGVKSFIGTDANVELRIGGPFEILFGPATAPKGTRGSEGMHVLSYLPKQMLSFEWNAPPTLGEMRDQRTFVVVQFEPVDAQRTRVTLTHLNFGTGPAWDAVYAYFDDAWASVLASLKQAIESPK
jgi:uncharacterized protein YndB with AHSA1/START domain/uncharacterized protein YciI